MRYLLFIILIASLNLSSQSSGGVLNSNTTVCQGSNNGILTLTASVGNILRWEFSQNVTGPWATIGFNGTIYAFSNLVQSTYFRVVVQQIGYPIAYSNAVLVTCDLPTVAGSIAATTLQCVNSAVTSTLSANTGSVLSWESTTNNWITTNTITSTNTLIATLSSLSTTTQIRAYVKNGVCPAVYTNTLTVNSASPSNGGSINGTQSVCANSNAATLTLSNYLGNILQWENSSSSGGPYNVIASSANTSTMTYINLPQTTWYRALVQNANCSAATSAAFSIHVDQPSNGGSIVGTQSVCAAANSGTLQLVSNVGSVNHWEQSTNSGTNWSLISNTLLVQTFSNILSSTLYRAEIQNGLCSASLSSIFTVNVNALPTVTFNTVNGCKSSLLSFTNLTSGTNTYVWDFGDATSSNAYHSSHSYTASGNFIVKLSATSNAGCVDSLNKTVTVYPQPVAIILSSDTACYGSTLMFHNAGGVSSGSMLGFSFNFNDGSSLSSQSPIEHSFPSSGSYSVTLKIVSDYGCADSTLKWITIYPKPLSNFSVPNVCKGNISYFNNLSSISNGALNYRWELGNGTLLSIPSPTYIYSGAGIYTVSLIANSNHNCKDTTYKTVTVNEKADLLSVTGSGCFGSTTSFNSVVTPTSLNVSTLLAFGDGATTPNITTSHFYNQPGTFIATLTAVTDSGCVTSILKSISIHPKPFADFNFNNVCNADSVKFNNTSAVSAGSLSYFWNLGVGTSLLKSPTALYPNSGNYLITLITKSNFACYDTLEKSITIFEAPKVNFNFSNSCNGFPVSFTNATTVNTGIISSYLWDFGNNSTSAALNPSVDYLNNGTYTVTLLATSSNGCTDTSKKTVSVYEGPIAKFTATSQCLNIQTTFSNQSILSSGSYSSYWRFGDETSSDQNSPFHTYTSASSKRVWLKVTSTNSCVDSTSFLLEVFPNPKIIAGRDTLLDKGLGLTLNASGGMNYNWYPIIGLNNPTLKNPFANPDSTTTYFVEGTDEHGCKGMDTVLLKINSDLDIYIYNIVTPDFNGLNDEWQIKNINYFPNNHVIIFDQWNQRVFEASSYHNEWDGKNQGGEILPDATYYYILTFKESEKKYSGYITLIRNK